MPVELPARVHATTLALAGKAAMIRGPSGSGKSDLALRCLTMQPSALVRDAAELVSDDYTEIFDRDGALWARAPEAIANLLEVRGLGLIEVNALHEAEVCLVADLVSPDQVERLPDTARFTQIAGFRVPSIALCAPEASAAAKLLVAIDHIARLGKLPAVRDDL